MNMTFSKASRKKWLQGGWTALMGMAGNAAGGAAAGATTAGGVASGLVKNSMESAHTPKNIPFAAETQSQQGQFPNIMSLLTAPTTRKKNDSEADPTQAYLGFLG